LAGFFAFLLQKLWYNGQKGGDEMKKILLVSVVMTLLVAARCVATIARAMYDNQAGWMNLIFRDSWFYVGVATAVIAVVCGAAMIFYHRKK
jgi:succinate dehydrogenase/fumarate reductase flavoprotein subunit